MGSTETPSPEVREASSDSGASSDAELFRTIETNLYSPVIGDVLDQLGRLHQFLPPGIAPLRSHMVVVGRAMPALVADVFGPQRKPFGLLTEALDQLEPGDVYVARGSAIPAAAWGELLTTTARARGARGAVIDGYHRDTPKVLEFDWPVFSHGAYGQDAGPRNSVTDFRVPVEIGGVLVKPGDIIFGDRDGVVVIPREIEAEVIEMAMEKSATENVVRKAIENGMTATDAFAKFGVL